jgi:hypothetical protein
MNSVRNHRLRDRALPRSTAWLLNDIAEAKCKQELFTRQSPQTGCGWGGWICRSQGWR